MKTGRKWFDGKDETALITKLEQAWALDCTDNEAAAYADISVASLCRYLQAHPKVSERKAALKEQPVLAARHTLVEAIRTRKDKDGNADLALKYLERKRRLEFAIRQEIEHTGDIAPVIIFTPAENGNKE